MTVEVTRTFIEGGQTRSETLVSKYQPWRAIYLVGSEADIPASARAEAAGSVSVESDATNESATEEATIDATTPVTGDTGTDTGAEETGATGPDQ
jgi:hypothetical protein